MSHLIKIYLLAQIRLFLSLVIKELDEQYVLSLHSELLIIVFGKIIKLFETKQFQRFGNQNRTIIISLICCYPPKQQTLNYSGKLQNKC